MYGDYFVSKSVKNYDSAGFSLRVCLSKDVTTDTTNAPYCRSTFQLRPSSNFVGGRGFFTFGRTSRFVTLFSFSGSLGSDFSPNLVS